MKRKSRHYNQRTHGDRRKDMGRERRQVRPGGDRRRSIMGRPEDRRK